jgi:hypothetical protein
MDAVKQINTHKFVKKKIRRDKDFDRVQDIVLRFIFLENGDENYNRRYKMSRALHYCSAKAIKPEAVDLFIASNGGIKGLYEADLREYPRGRKKRYQITNEEFFADLSDIADGSDEKAMRDYLAQLEKTLSGMRGIDGIDRIVVEVDRKQFSRLCQMGVGQKSRTYRLKRRKPEGDPWVHIYGKRVRQKAN